MNKTLNTSLAATALLAAHALSPATAHACGGGWYDDGPRIDYRIGGVARAERDLEKGKYAQAAASVLRMIPHIAGYQAGRGDALVRRGQRVLALAIARSHGDPKMKHLVPEQSRKQWLGDSAKTRARNVNWSIQILSHRAKGKAANPIAKVELAEAIANDPTRRNEARRILEELAQNDLLPTANGYALLALLRGQAGDEAGRLAAMKRCSSMTKHNAVCSTGRSVS